MTKEALRKEFGDVLVNLLSLCRKMDIDPSELPAMALETLRSFAERIPEYQKYRKEKEDGFCGDDPRSTPKS